LTVTYLQFDGLTSEPYVQARGFDALPIKLQALRNLREADIPTTLVPTVVKGVNDNQLVTLSTSVSRTSIRSKL